MQFLETLDDLSEDILAEAATAIASATAGKQLISIYENPSSSKMAQINKENSLIHGLRIIVDIEKNKMYMFNAELTHSAAAQEIYKKIISDTDGKHFYGFADTDGKTKGFRYLLRRNKEEKKSYDKVRKMIDDNKFITWGEQF